MIGHLIGHSASQVHLIYKFSLGLTSALAPGLVSVMYYAIWFGLGVILTIPLLVLASRLKLHSMKHLLGITLILAAVIYIGFAVVWGDSGWLFVETLGVPAYALFYWLSTRHSIIWLSVGWLLHPVWDVVLHLLGPGSHIAPAWYAVACVSFDIVVAAYIFSRVKRTPHNAYQRH